VVEASYRGYFVGATDMTKALVTAWADGSFVTKIRTYSAPSVLVIDDVGITSFDRAEANAVYQVVNRRYEHGSAPSSPPTEGFQAGGRSSAEMPSWPLPSSIACSTK
jgi:DNA replication protein DnaC